MTVVASLAVGFVASVLENEDSGLRTHVVLLIILAISVVQGGTQALEN